MKIILTTTTFALGWIATAAGQQEMRAVEVFMSYCLEGGPRFVKTVETARAQHWDTLAPDLAMAFTPVSHPTDIQGWILEAGTDHPFQALVVFKGLAAP